MDRFHVQIHSLTPLTEQGYKIFKGVIFSTLINNVTQAILDNIRKERDGELIDDGLLKEIVDIYLHLSSESLLQDFLNCKKFLEEKILEQTK